MVPPKHPSAFYNLFDGARRVTLAFPVTDSIGPFWDEDGALLHSPGDTLAQEDIEAVQIGGDHYRLACRSDGPFSVLRLHWGDEFITENNARLGLLRLVRVVMPQPYMHHRILVSEQLQNDQPAARLAHELGGGWETVAVGQLTLTVPASRAAEFLRRMGNTPGSEP